MVKKIKKELKTLRGRIILAFVLVASIVITWTVLTKTSAGPTEENIRTITLKIRGMTFGDNNPTIHLLPEETVRFVIHNLSVGMKHNFLIQGTNVRTRFLNYGEKEAVLFRAPTKGELDYLCSIHALMMKGKLHIVDDLAKND